MIWVERLILLSNYVFSAHCKFFIVLLGSSRIDCEIPEVYLSYFFFKLPFKCAWYIQKKFTLIHRMFHRHIALIQIHLKSIFVSSIRKKRHAVNTNFSPFSFFFPIDHNITLSYPLLLEYLLKQLVYLVPYVP